MFRGDTILQRLSTKSYVLCSDLEWIGNTHKVVVREGLVTDGASIPRIFHTVIGCPLMGKYVGPALIHDGLYASQLCERKVADELFLELLEEVGVSVLRRYAMYLAVRIGGWVPWNKKTNQEIEKYSKCVDMVSLCEEQKSTK